MQLGTLRKWKRDALESAFKVKTGDLLAPAEATLLANRVAKLCNEMMKLYADLHVSRRVRIEKVYDVRAGKEVIDA